ncbi:phage terminase large subunit [Bifidobacterium thermophilum]|uniref:Phage terminase large subunit n=1 Tax=Bifidobacterium thermophilum TaxID=33905 RepID=A0A2N3QNY8_9BIFI|nr:phage terminase large subunit [Bifidobacterium thermophilum]PKU93344.1 phage terminase large subunit [Bifidobacterium thermophilum]
MAGRAARDRDRSRAVSLAYEEFRLKEFERDRDGTWVDEIPDGNDHSIDAVRYAVMDDVPRGA